MSKQTPNTADQGYRLPPVDKYQGRRGRYCCHIVPHHFSVSVVRTTRVLLNIPTNSVAKFFDSKFGPYGTKQSNHQDKPNNHQHGQREGAPPPSCPLLGFLQYSPYYSRGRRADSSAVVCRVTVFGVQGTGSKNTASASPNTHQKTICIPIVDDQELDNDFEIELPSELASEYPSDIHQGKLIVSILGAALDDNGLLQISDAPQFTVLSDPRFDRHRVRHLEATGTKSVAVIRVSTLDASPKDSATTLKSTLFGSGGTNFVTQSDACSHGNLKWELKNNEILDVQVPVYVTNYANDSAGRTWRPGTCTIFRIQTCTSKLARLTPAMPT